MDPVTHSLSKSRSHQHTQWTSVIPKPITRTALGYLSDLKNQSINSQPKNPIYRQTSRFDIRRNSFKPINIYVLSPVFLFLFTYFTPNCKLELKYIYRSTSFGTYINFIKTPNLGLSWPVLIFKRKHGRVSLAREGVTREQWESSKGEANESKDGHEKQERGEEGSGLATVLCSVQYW
jgi:hypothetical protein